MDFKEYLKEKQVFVYKTFTNALKNNKLSQCYLIKGSEGSPVLECAKFLAKTLVCENKDDDFLACSSCLNCIRFDENNYADFMLLDAEKQTLKVNDIENLQEFLSQSTMEKTGKKIYIIHCLENCNKETVNALLKTLEEPNENVFCFITTKNESKLLPTILSRCQILNLLPVERNEIILEAQEKGVSIDDSQILSILYSNVDAIINNIDNPTYSLAKETLFDTLDCLDESPLKTLLYVEQELIPQMKTKELARMYIDLLSIAFKDILLVKMDQKPYVEIYEEKIKSIAKKYNNIDKIYLEIMLTRGKIDLNVSIALILEHIFIYIIKGGK